MKIVALNIRRQRESRGGPARLAAKLAKSHEPEFLRRLAEELLALQDDPPIAGTADRRVRTPSKRRMV